MRARPLASYADHAAGTCGLIGQGRHLPERTSAASETGNAAGTVRVASAIAPARECLCGAVIRQPDPCDGLRFLDIDVGLSVGEGIGLRIVLYYLVEKPL